MTSNTSQTDVINKLREIVFKTIYPMHFVNIQGQPPKYTDEQQLQILEQVIKSSDQTNKTLLDIYDRLFCPGCDGS